MGRGGHYPLTYNFVLKKSDRHIQCYLCGMPTPEKRITKDHVYPKSKGGIIKAPACLNCNIAKEDMLPIDFAILYTKEGKAIPSVPIGYDPEEETGQV